MALAMLLCGAAGVEARSPARPVPLLEGLGSHSLAITTRSAEAQRYFDQGLMLAWGFHFAAAERSFREAARHDPGCAMCRWGIAYALGPSINHDPTPRQVEAARAALAEAVSLAPEAGARERGLIEALAHRFGARGEVDEASYLRSMRPLARRHPGDADVLTLLADAQMAPRGRDYWRKDGRAQPWTRAILDTLDKALRADPDHPGAHHLRIHALEASPHPRRALDSAERLPGLAPGLGHLVHMPAHVYFRLGRHADVIQINERAIEADRRLHEALGGDPAYAAGYAAHNHHFLWAASMMSGRHDKAMAAARSLARNAGSQSGTPSGTSQHFAVLALYTQVRFGRWDEVLRAPRPEPSTAYTQGVWHFARAIALARSGRNAQAKKELEELSRAQKQAVHEAGTFKNVNALWSLLAIARRIAQAEVAAASGDAERAIVQARSAVALETALDADEPPAWPLPARHVLGALLLEQGRVAEAQRIYEQDLRVHPDNGWALAGLAASLRQSGRTAQADEATRRFERAWADADARIEGSRQ